MRCLSVCSVILIAAAVAAAEDFQVGEYYEPYGRCVSVETTSADTVYHAPAVYYTEEPDVYPAYYSQPVYYPKVVRYAEPVYYPVYVPYSYRPGPYYRSHWPYSYWRSRRDYHRWRRWSRRHCD